MAAIEVAGLTKKYGGTEALRGVDLLVPEGCLFGLLGPNGAGKTTLIKALVGALRPTGGRVRVLELEPLRQRGQLRQQIGYMPQSPALYEDLSTRGNVAFFGAAHVGADLSVRHGLDERVDEVLELTGLAERANDRVHTLSGGMKGRVSLAAALVHRPRVLFLDEPTAGVDPYLRARLWDTFRRLASEGITLFISTHQMDEAMLCDRVAIMLAGRIIVADSPWSLLEMGRSRLSVQEDGEARDLVIGGRPEDLAAALRPFGLRSTVRALSVRSDSLEDVMLSLIEREADR